MRVTLKTFAITRKLQQGIERKDNFLRRIAYERTHSISAKLKQNSATIFALFVKPMILSIKLQQITKLL